MTVCVCLDVFLVYCYEWVQGVPSLLVPLYFFTLLELVVLIPSYANENLLIQQKKIISLIYFCLINFISL